MSKVTDVEVSAFSECFLFICTLVPSKKSADKMGIKEMANCLVFNHFEEHLTLSCDLSVKVIITCEI